MENIEKKLTINFSTTKNIQINDGKQAFYILHKVRIEKGIKIADLCRKIGLPNTMYHRYLQYYEKQQTNSPPVTVLSTFAEAIGYEIQIVEKKTKEATAPKFKREYIYKTEFNINNKAKKYKLLPTELINKYTQGDIYEVFIRKHVSNEKLYDYFVYQIGDRNKEVCSNGRVGAEALYNTMEKYNINPNKNKNQQVD